MEATKSVIVVRDKVSGIYSPVSSVQSAGATIAVLGVYAKASDRIILFVVAALLLLIYGLRLINEISARQLFMMEMRCGLMVSMTEAAIAIQNQRNEINQQINSHHLELWDGPAFSITYRSKYVVESNAQNTMG